MKKMGLFLIFFLIALIILPGGTASWKDTLFMEGVLKTVSNPVDDVGEKGDLSESVDNNPSEGTGELGSNELPYEGEPSDEVDNKDPSEQTDEPVGNVLPEEEEGQPEFVEPIDMIPVDGSGQEGFIPPVEEPDQLEKPADQEDASDPTTSDAATDENNSGLENSIIDKSTE